MGAGNIKKLKEGKASGPDVIPIRLFKMLERTCKSNYDYCSQISRPVWMAMEESSYDPNSQKVIDSRRGQLQRRPLDKCGLEMCRTCNHNALMQFFAASDAYGRNQWPSRKYLSSRLSVFEHFTLDRRFWKEANWILHAIYPVRLLKFRLKAQPDMQK